MSWDQLKVIIDESRKSIAEAQAAAPDTCPVDGEPLDVHPDGRRNCPFGNYSWP